MASSSVGAMAAASSSSGSGVMMFIEAENKIVLNTVFRFLADPAARGALDSTISDFDGTTYKMVITDADPNTLTVNVSIPYFASIPDSAVAAMLASSFPGMAAKPESADFHLAVRVTAPPGAPSDDADAVAHRVARLAVDTAGCLFRPALEALASGGTPTSVLTETAEVRYRTSERLWVVPRPDRLTTIWSLEFTDVFDGTLARMIASELSEAGRKVAGSPPAGFFETTSPPSEVGDARVTDNTAGFVSITLLPNNVDTPAKLTRAVDRLVLLRAYFLYHIKAAKAALHARMRARVGSWLNVIRQATPKDATGAAGKRLKTGAMVVLAASRATG